MIKSRIIPTLLLKDYSLVKGVAFDSWRTIGTVLPSVKVFNARDVDELILVDISASKDKRNFKSENIKEIADNCFVPLTVGGGIDSLESAKNLIENGCDKISVNSSIFNNPELIHEIASSFGSQAVVASLDVKKINNNYICFSHSGTINTGLNPIEVAKKVGDLGAGEILLTSIDNDGTLKGYDYDLLEKVSANTKLPIIASGGAGKPEHMLKAIKECGVSAVAAASIFQFTEITPNDIRDYLNNNNITVRKLG